MRGLLILALAFIAAACLVAPSNGGELPKLDLKTARKVEFRRHVWPILKRHCWGCHSAMEPKGGLRVDSVQALLEGGDSGPAVVPGKPDESPLVEMVLGAQPEMPKKQPPLSAAKRHVLRQWVFAGATADPAPGAETRVVIPETYRFAPAVTSVALTPDGRRVAAACRSEVVLLDVAADATPIRLATDSDLVTHVEFSPDGKQLVAIGGTPARFGEVRVFRANDGRLEWTRRLSHDTLFRGQFAPDGKNLAVGGADGAIHVIPLDKDAPPRRLELHSDWVLDVAFSTDGKLLFSAGRDKATKVSSFETGKLLRTVDNSTELVSSVVADGQFAVSGGRARTLLGYQLKIALSGIEVSGAGNATRPVSKRNQYVKNFGAQQGEILTMATSGDRKHLAVAGAFGEVRVYTIADRKRVATLSGIQPPVYGVDLNADGTRLAVATRSGHVTVYSLPDLKRLLDRVPVPVAGDQ